MEMPGQQHKIIYLMRRFILAAAAAVALAPLAARAWTVPDETLQYQINYKWGFIDANAGVATVTAENVPGTGTFRATLTGRSVQLLGHEYVGGDTIVGTLMSDTVRSVMTQRLSYSAGEFEIETITYPDGSAKDGEIVRRLPDGKVVRSRISHYGGGLTVDLLGVYYYMRQIDYTQMTPGQSVRVNVFSGKSPETLDVTYNGKVMADSCGCQVETFSVSLDFSTPPPGNSSDHLEAWISTGADRVPVRVVGTLKFGRMDCRLMSVEAVKP